MTQMFQSMFFNQLQLHIHLHNLYHWSNWDAGGGQADIGGGLRVGNQYLILEQTYLCSE